MGELLINNWGGWIGDDPFLARDGECLDMDGIDIRTTPRRITADYAFLWNYATETAPYNDTLNHVTETLDWVVQSYGSHCYINSSNIDSLVAGSDKHITVGSNLSDYNATTNPEWVRHIFFTYDNSTNPIKIVGYTSGSRAIIWTAISTSGGASPANIVSSRTTAVCYLWKGAIIFARGSKIYELNPETATLSSWAKVELPVGAVVKYITYQGGLINFVYTINNDTYIHGCTYDGTTYKLYPYSDKKAWEKCINATHDGWYIYWLSTSGIFQYSGTSQLVKKYAFTTSAVCAYGKGILRIGDSTNFYEYGINKPWYGNPLTKKSISLPIQWVTEQYIMTFQSWASKFRLESINSVYKQVNTYTTHPYSAWQFGWKKKWLWLLLGVALPRLASYTDSSIICSISIWIQTDLMERVNTVTYATVYTETNPEARVIHITPKMITDALSGYSDEWGYIRFKITLNAWDPYSGYWNTLFRMTPEVYDVYFTHTEVDNPFK